VFPGNQSEKGSVISLTKEKRDIQIEEERALSPKKQKERGRNCPHLVGAGKKSPSKREEFWGREGKDKKKTAVLYDTKAV